MSGNFDLLHKLIDSGERSVAVHSNGTDSRYLHPNHLSIGSAITNNSSDDTRHLNYSDFLVVPPITAQADWSGLRVAICVLSSSRIWVATWSCHVTSNSADTEHTNRFGFFDFTSGEEREIHSLNIHKFTWHLHHNCHNANSHSLKMIFKIGLQTIVTKV